MGEATVSVLLVGSGLGENKWLRWWVKLLHPWGKKKNLSEQQAGQLENNLLQVVSQAPDSKPGGIDGTLQISDWREVGSSGKRAEKPLFSGPWWGVRDLITCQSLRGNVLPTGSRYLAKLNKPDATTSLKKADFGLGREERVVSQIEH